MNFKQFCKKVVIGKDYKSNIFNPIRREVIMIRKLKAGKAVEISI
jgi:hypothetical protein